MLELAQVSTFYGPKQALFGLDLAVAEREAVTLMGRNGAGTTTTVHTIMGFTPARRGRVLFDGQDITRRSPHRIARAGIAIVPEGRQIFPNLTVTENLIATAANRRAARSPWTIERIFELFPRLAERRRHMGGQLSGGEQQMLAIGRALMTNPKIVLLDEATEGIAPVVRDEIWRCLESLRRDGLSLLIIDKNIDALTAIADRHYIVQKGKVVWHGSSAELLAEPSICIEFLGV
ncbi:MAG: ABC transporter ATP-binding protein [Stellaceae bacterium]